MPTRKRTTSRKRTATRKDAISLLKKDHEKVRSLLSQLEKSAERGGDRAMQLVSQVEAEVKVHSQIEEEIFYPAYRDAADREGAIACIFQLYALCAAGCAHALIAKREAGRIQSHHRPDTGARKAYMLWTVARIVGDV